MEAVCTRRIHTMPRTRAAVRKRRNRRFLAKCFAWVLMLGAAALSLRIASGWDDTFLAGLPVEPVLQKPELPNGCEAASLTQVLNHLGFPADKMEIAYDYIPRVDFTEDGSVRTGPNPETAYPGDPATSRGFYCFAGPVCEGANAYLEAQGSALRAYDVTGVTQEGLREYLNRDIPVIVWVTLDFSAPYKGDFVWTDTATGEVIEPYMNLHCIVLTGMGEDLCVVADPLRGTRHVDKTDFLRSFAEVGSRAVVID